MSARQPGPYDTVARKWLDLAERRLAHIIELRDSGRWKHYFTIAELHEQLRNSSLARDQWAKIAGVEEHREQAAA